MENPKEVSLFASAARPKLWKSFLDSLKDTTVNFEVVFAGPELPEEHHPQLRFIQTDNIKPATCYELARRKCIGETVIYVADDCEFPNDVIGKAYNYWKSQNNEKLILSIQTKESGYKNFNGSLFNMNEHRFFSWVPESPLMAPLGMMSRKFLEDLGGIDQRYVAGQYENDIVMRAYTKGAKVEIFGGEDCYIDIDHLGKSIAIGESTNQEDFLQRPFATAYQKDREVLEASWTTFDQRDLFLALQKGEQPLTVRKVSDIQLDEFMPYPEDIPLDHSLSNKGKWI